MKEMLFIMVAILVPPTLTYLGFVGDSHAQRAELSWELARPGTATAQHTPLSQSGNAVDRLCWYQSSF